jgi:hypothetical protein
MLVDELVERIAVIPGTAVEDAGNLPGIKVIPP